MKTGTQGVGARLSSEELKKLTKEVKETLAFGSNDQNKTFSSVDLWNIRRQRKSTQLRRLNA